MDFGAAWNALLNNPIVIDVYTLFVIATLNFFWVVYLSISSVPRTFDWQKLPRIADTLILRKVFPLILLGVATFTVKDPTSNMALTVAYHGLFLVLLAGEVKQLIDQARGQSPIQLAARNEFDAGQGGGPPTDPAG